MDTINIRFKFTRELTANELYNLSFNHNYIERVTLSKTTANQYYISFSVPKFCSKTNAYLVKSQDFYKFKESILNLFAPIMISATVYRVDTPFTYLITCNETFNDYSHIFYLFSHAYYVVTRHSSTKNYEETITKVKESFLMGDQSNLNKSNTKIIIYDQAQKIEDFDTSENKNMFQKIKTEFPDITRRIRFEVSRKTNISLENLDYSDQYHKSYEYLEKSIFDEEALKISLEMLYEDYKEVCIKNRSFLPESIISFVKIFEYDVYRLFLKELTNNNKTLESRITRVRKLLNDTGRASLYKIRLKKVLPEMKKQFKDQINW